MPRRPRSVTYAEAMAALRDTYRTLQSILRLRLGPQTRERLELLRDQLERLVTRDNGRSQ